MYSDIDNLFKNGVSDYSQKPPVFIWDTIEQSLRKKREARRRNIVYSIAASVALLLAFGAGYLFTGIPFSNKTIVHAIVPAVTTDVNQQEANTSDNQPNNVSKSTSNSESSEAIVKTDEQKDLNAKPIKTNESKPLRNTNENQKQSNVKKVSSMGTLMPPGFGSNAEYADASLISDHQADVSYMREVGIEKLNPKKIDVSNEKNIVYVYREMPMISDYDAYSESKSTNIWAVGISATPLLSYRTVGSASSDIYGDAGMNSDTNNDYSNEEPLSAYSAGVDVNYSVAKRWNIQAGVYFSEIGQISENSTVYSSKYPNDGGNYYVNTSSGEVRIEGSMADLQNNLYRGFESSDAIVSFPGTSNTYKDATIKNDFVQSYSYCEFPVLVNYKIIDRRLDMKVSGGMSANILYDYGTYLQNDEVKYALDSENDNIKTMSYNGIVGIGLEYPIISNLNVNLNPTFRYSLSSLTNTNSVHPYSLGIFTGLIYIF